MGTLLTATVNLTPTATVLEAIVWLAYTVVVLSLFFRPVRSAPPRPVVTPAGAAAKQG